MSKNYIITIFGMSGVGKTYLQYYLQKQYHIPRLITHTTRSPRPNETNGVDYYFNTVKQFKKLDLLEYTKFDNNYYGSALTDIKNNWKHGKHLVSTVLDYNGVKAYKKVLPNNTVPIYLDCTIPVVEKRLAKRGMPKSDIKARVKQHIHDIPAENDMIFNNKYHIQLISTLKWSLERKVADLLIHDLEK